MDDAARLVSKLQAKLAELDGKVAAYERGMLAEFHRHMVDCLKNYPEHVSNEVSRIIAESMSKYPALNSTSRDRPQSPASISVTDRRIREGRKSPPPVLKHTSGTPVIRSPHEREKEFQGLFTPSYLPLLDSKDRVPHSPPISPLPTEPSLVLPSESVREVEVPKVPEAAKEEVRPAPVRRLTDRSSSSLESSGSETKVRRSALRRSSSSTKGSPRRVRFDFEGEEVFPSVDPLAFVILDLETRDDGAVAAEAEAQPEADTSVITLENESLPAYTGTSLLDVEGEEDWLPKPKKVSSTQALRALTRSPLDEGTVWTVVDPESDDISKMNGENKTINDRKVGASNPTIAPAKSEPRASIRAENSDARKRSDTSESLDSAIDEEDEDTSDDEFLSMRPKSSAGRTSMSPGTRSPGTAPAPDDSARTPTLSSTRLDEFRDQDEDEDALFDFEQEGGRTAPQPQTRRHKYLVDETDDDDESGALESVTVSELRVVAEAAESAAPLELVQGTRIPPTSPSTVLFGNSVGSYKGHPLRINPINNQQLYDEIAGMKDVHFFVGSVEDDPGSYRASVSRAFAGTPRSFTERLALEEVMEKRKSDAEADREADRL
ncbi:hypothetical protein B0T22DRAFT_416279 [Podospora appendiculata]|uniref:Uncharacterized protein n=1 Tax=Podospora appendiculata TaxID=314037 RepID=A0AAE1CFA6_9PEZI|nr:hypothetical protein B0T22DRAFT_416279 [Podospora appendiculata]